MRYWSIPLTVVLLGIPFAISTTGADDSVVNMVVTALVLLSAVWVGIDAHSFRSSLLVFFFWPVAFPWYMFKREHGGANLRTTLPIVAGFIATCFLVTDPVRKFAWDNIATNRMKTEYHRRILTDIRQELRSSFGGGHLGFNKEVQHHAEKLVELGYFFRKEYQIERPAESRFANMSKNERDLSFLIWDDILFSGDDGVLGGKGWVKPELLTTTWRFVAYDVLERETEYDKYFESLRDRSEPTK